MFGTLLPFFLIDVLKMGGSGHNEPVSYNIALVPMIAYASSVLVSTRINWFYKTFGRKTALFLGTILCIGCLAIMFFLTENNAWIMYILALFIGKYD
jgi:Na+/melibiose symporter-like transporter